MTQKKAWTLEDLNKVPVGKGMSTAKVAGFLPRGQRYRLLREMFHAWGITVTDAYLREVVCLGNRAAAVQNKIPKNLTPPVF